jgi:4'-phosphopantetheinyl transferase
VAAKESVRRVAGEGVDPRAIEISNERLGAPSAAVRGHRIPVSLSHGDGCAAAASALHARIGVDVELIRPLPSEFSRYFLHPIEEKALRGWNDPSTASLAAWAVKEAVLKARGLGLSIPPKAVTIRDIGPDGRVTVDVDGAGIGVTCWREDGIVVAVAGSGPASTAAISVSRSEMR